MHRALLQICCFYNESIVTSVAVDQEAITCVHNKGVMAIQDTFWGRKNQICSQGILGQIFWAKKKAYWIPEREFQRFFVARMPPPASKSCHAPTNSVLLDFHAMLVALSLTLELLRGRLCEKVPAMTAPSRVWTTACKVSP
eukprot:6473126-Amphidinium_carterae.1